MSHHHSSNHKDTQSILLIQKLLTFRPEISPFTLVLDSVEQGSDGFVRSVARGVEASKTNIIYISYGPLAPPSGTSTFIKARQKTPGAVKAEIASACPQTQRNLLIISPLNPLISHPNLNIATYLLSLISLTPQTSLLAIHHVDVPLPLPPSPSHQPPRAPSPRHSTQNDTNPYAPPPLHLLSYLATTILTLRSFPQSLARKRARDRAIEPPAFGLQENKEGIVSGMGANSYNVKDGAEGMVLEMEHRRKSGRSVHETYYLPPPPPSPTISITPHSSTASRSPATSAPSSASSPSAPFQHIIPLSTHPLFRPPPQNANESDKEAHGATFNLRLTDKQRKEREGVVLPFLDAQRPGLGGDYGGGNGGGRNWGEGEWEGRGEGGRILYDMGVEDLDDFDEEEDEI